MNPSIVLNAGGLDPDSIRISRHALGRYMERRHWTHDDEVAADLAIRRQLRKVAHLRPPIRVAGAKFDGNAIRMFVGAQMVWIVSADFSTLITFYKGRPRTKSTTIRRGRRS